MKKAKLEKLIARLRVQLVEPGRSFLVFTAQSAEDLQRAQPALRALVGQLRKDVPAWTGIAVSLVAGQKLDTLPEEAARLLYAMLKAKFEPPVPPVSEASGKALDPVPRAATNVPCGTSGAPVGGCEVPE